MEVFYLICSMEILPHVYTGSLPCGWQTNQLHNGIRQCLKANLSCHFLGETWCTTYIILRNTRVLFPFYTVRTQIKLTTKVINH